MIFDIKQYYWRGGKHISIFTATGQDQITAKCLLTYQWPWLAPFLLDPPRFDPEDLVAFTEPVTVKVGHNVFFKLHFVGHEPIKIKWYREGEELLEDNNTKLENSANHSRLLLIRCQRKDTGDIKIKLKNEHGFTEAISQLIVLGEWMRDSADIQYRKVSLSSKYIKHNNKNVTLFQKK